MLWMTMDIPTNQPEAVGVSKNYAQSHHCLMATHQQHLACNGHHYDLKQRHRLMSEPVNPTPLI